MNAPRKMLICTSQVSCMWRSRSQQAFPTKWLVQCIQILSRKKWLQLPSGQNSLQAEKKLLGIDFCAATHNITGKNALANLLSSVMHIFCNAAFCSTTLYRFLVGIPTGPEFGNALHYRKRFGELMTFCKALHYMITCFENLFCNHLRPDGTDSVFIYTWNRSNCECGL